MYMELQIWMSFSNIKLFELASTDLLPWLSESANHRKTKPVFLTYTAHPGNTMHNFHYTQPRSVRLCHSLPTASFQPF